MSHPQTDNFLESFMEAQEEREDRRIKERLTFEEMYSFLYKDNDNGTNN